MIRAEFLFFGLSLWAMTGRSPNRNIAHGNTLGVSELSNLRSERAAGVSSLAILPIPFALSERKIVFQFLPRVLPWAVFLLGFQPAIARTIVAAQSSRLYFCWFFTPPFLVTTVAAQSSGLYFCSAFSPSFLVTTVSTQSSALYSCSAFSLSSLVTTVSTQSSDLYYFWVLSPPFLVTMAAAQSSALYFFGAFSSPLYSV